GFPDAQVFMLAVPTAVIAYIIAFGDIIVGQSLMQRADELRTDEKIEINV
ncbi:MAG TPA: xanthine/uracil/vitamin C permease, partial [Pseudomonas sp.]|nr:xanthine/uracil/vitamin C permease [Pseudomonas sp.]